MKMIMKMKMKGLIVGMLTVIVCGEPLVTKESTAALRERVSWEVVEYEDNVFRGWTVEEARRLLGQPQLPGVEFGSEEAVLPVVEVRANLPSSVDWRGASCDHGVRDQGQCFSCWAFAVVGMLSDRCCLQKHDHGWLSVQEILSCDKMSHGCSGGWGTWALDYVISQQGLVTETCFPYKAMNLPCPSSSPCKCANGEPCKRFCNCAEGYYKICNSVAALKTCLQTGPVAAGMEVCQSLYSYKSGIYRCECGSNFVGLHGVLLMGYAETPSPNYHVRNTWGTAWGMKGYFDIAVDTCGISGKYTNANFLCETLAP